MKEAAGEANLTVVAIILIGVVVAVATPLINTLMSSTSQKACCTDAGGMWKNGACVDVDGNTVSYSWSKENGCKAATKAP